MDVVIDSGVFISAVILNRGPTADVLRMLHQGDLQALYCESTLMELVKVLNRPKFNEKYGVDLEDTSELLKLVRLRGKPIKNIPNTKICRDPKDDIFLNLAIAGDAEAIISGDNDLLALHPYSGIPILTPKQFIQFIDNLYNR